MPFVKVKGALKQLVRKVLEKLLVTTVLYL